MQKVVYISNSRDYIEQKDINGNRYLAHINQLLTDGWVISKMDPVVVEVAPDPERHFYKETLVSFVVLEKNSGS